MYVLKFKKNVSAIPCNDFVHTVVMATERIMAALGRPFTLGMLYDARKEQIVPGRFRLNSQFKNDIVFCIN